MKKLMLGLMAMLLTATVAFAQTGADALRNATRAYDNFSANSKVEKLQEAVDQIAIAANASDVQGTFDLAMAQGDIYGTVLQQRNLYRQLNQDLSELPEVDELGRLAAEGYMQAYQLADKKGKKRKALQALQDLQQNISNGGIYAIQGEDYANSLSYFSTAKTVHDFITANDGDSFYDALEDKSQLSNEIYYAGLSALLLEDFTAAKPLYMQLKDMDYNDAGLYDGLFRIAQNEGDDESAITYLKEGRMKFPEDNSLLFSEINYYLTKGELDVLLESLRTAIEREPTNVGLYTTLGNVYDKLYQDAYKAEDEETANNYFNQAKSYYEQALGLDEHNATAIYSLGALYYNRGANMSLQLEELSNDLSRSGQARYDEVKQAVDAEFERALPYFVKAEQEDPNDNNVLIALREMYARKGEYDLSNEFKERYDRKQAGETLTSYFAQ